MEEENADLNTSLLRRDDASELDLLERTGTTWTAVAHILAGVAGAGVLPLAWSVAQLGWILGPLCIIIFAAMTLFSSFLLAECYRHPDPEHGPIRNRSFMEATKLYLGDKHHVVFGFLIQFTIFGVAVVFTSTAGSSLRAIQQSNCYHKYGHDAPCQYGDNLYMMLFGFVNIFLSQIPNFHSTRWISIMALVMSLCFSFIGIGLELAKVIENGTVKGSITGVPGSDSASKTFLVFTALADIAFATPFTIILLEIEDTLKSPPPVNKTMKVALTVAVSIITLFYLTYGCIGYAAFGDSTPENLLTGFGFYEPYWLVDFANACVVIYLMGAYQIYGQASFAMLERWLRERFPDSRLLNKSYSFKFPLLPTTQMNLFQACFRTFYVVIATLIAVIFPYFTSVIGVVGTVIFWPSVVYGPVRMYLVQRQVRTWSRKWILLTAFNMVGFIITVVGFIGSLAELVSAKIN
ncbi:probable amino acid permease 7 [Punica granatum]|uniref:Probable amino acid permease 7 n=1 Tax=Punica granatum TaxID=22663 RepID=A0A6P8E995_PUNGR|nr:probable amino acid permease 7 [Punica granatum]